MRMGIIFRIHPKAHRMGLSKYVPARSDRKKEAGSTLFIPLSFVQGLWRELVLQLLQMEEPLQELVPLLLHLQPEPGLLGPRRRPERLLQRQPALPLPWSPEDQLLQ